MLVGLTRRPRTAQFRTPTLPLHFSGRNRFVVAIIACIGDRWSVSEFVPLGTSDSSSTLMILAIHLHSRRVTTHVLSKLAAVAWLPRLPRPSASAAPAVATPQKCASCFCPTEDIRLDASDDQTQPKELLRRYPFDSVFKHCCIHSVPTIKISLVLTTHSVLCRLVLSRRNTRH